MNQTIHRHKKIYFMSRIVESRAISKFSSFSWYTLYNKEVFHIFLHKISHLKKTKQNRNLYNFKTYLQTPKLLLKHDITGVKPWFYHKQMNLYGWLTELFHFPWKFLANKCNMCKKSSKLLFSNKFHVHFNIYSYLLT